VLVTSAVLSLPLQKREGFEYGAFALPLTKGKGWEGVSSYVVWYTKEERNYLPYD
jgi:hypothetical protein